jgi:outer membrane lipoprotein-sorting protein
METRFRVMSMTQTNSVVQLLLQPTSASARKFVAALQVSFSVKDFSPVSTELRFSDGSAMRNDFTHAVVNLPLDEGLFDVKLEPGFTVVEPLRQ